MKEKKNKGNKIFKEAEKLFEKYGYRKVSVDDIVRKAGVAKGTFYLYFKSKDELYNKIIKTYYDLSEEMINDFTEEERKDIRLFFYKDIMYSLFYFKDKNIFKEIILENRNYYSETVSFEKIIEMDINFVGTVYDAKIREFRQDMPTEVMMKMVNMLFVALLRYEKDYEEKDFIEFAGVMVRVLGDGLFFQGEWNETAIEKINNNILTVLRK